MLGQVTGNVISLRLVNPTDASYIYSLRVNPAYNQHLSSVTGSVDDQSKWIEAYKLRETKGLEYYFVIQRLDGISCGVVRLYGITEESFTWGSWILDHNKPPKAALESALLIYHFAFEKLNLKRSVFDVRLDNQHTIDFHHRFGATEVGRDGENIYFELSREKYLNGREHQLSIIKRNCNDEIRR